MAVRKCEICGEPVKQGATYTIDSLSPQGIHETFEICRKCYDSLQKLRTETKFNLDSFLAGDTKITRL